MKQATKKQIVARARNWNKKMVAGVIYSLRSMCCCNHMRIGLTADEALKIMAIHDQIKQLLVDWRKTI